MEISATEESTFTVNESGLAELQPIAASTPSKVITPPDENDGNELEVSAEVEVQFDVLHPCEQCEYKTKWKCNLRRHRTQMHDDIKYLCTVPNCDKAFASVYYLRRHQRDVHPAGGPNTDLICEHCAGRAPNNQALDRHYMTAHGIGGHKCNDCDKAFPDSVLLANHRRTHTKEKPFRCGRCESMFVTKATLKRHLERCGEPDSRKKQCGQCGKKYSTAAILAVHVRGKHGNTPLNCVCGKEFKYPSCLCKHRKNCEMEQRGK